MKSRDALRELQARQEGERREHRERVRAQGRELTERHRAELHELLPDVARAFWERSEATKPTAPLLDDRSRAVRQAVLDAKTLSSPVKTAALQVLGAMLGADLGAIGHSRADAFQPGFFLVPLNDPNSHNLAGRAVMVVESCSDGESKAVAPDGEVTGWLPPATDPLSLWRQATEAEILAAIAGWPLPVLEAAIEPAKDEDGDWVGIYQAMDRVGRSLSSSVGPL